MADKVNMLHPRRILIGFSTVTKVIMKFNETGSIMDNPCSWRPSVSIKIKEIVIVKVFAIQKNQSAGHLMS